MDANESIPTDPGQAAYRSLEAHYRRLSGVRGAQRVLAWDTAAMMPDGGRPARAHQAATLASIAHEMATDPRIGEWIAAAADAALDDWQAANLREIRHDYLHATCVPADLVEAMAHAESESESMWRQARRAAQFGDVAPKLEVLLGLLRQYAAVKAEALGVAPYDAMLDMYDHGRRDADIAPIFADLAETLPPLVDAIIETQAAGPDPLPIAGPFPIDVQRQLARDVMVAMGFDFAHGRLDESAHPFTGGTADDVRLTTRYDEADFIGGLMGVIHETGHALYERGLPQAWRGQPVGRSRGMTIHESQSLLMEMQAGRSDAFLQWLGPAGAAAFGRDDDPAWHPDNLARHYRRVARSPIRVDADEVTYPLHIVLRWRLEKALLAGDLAVADLPGAWNDGMAQLLGYTPQDDAEGCLQDIHWYAGSIGYFPTYTLGALAAAQLFAAARAAIPDVESHLARGDFRALLGWLREGVHGQARRFSPDDLIERATGRPLDAACFKAHVNARYLDAG